MNYITHRTLGARSKLFKWKFDSINGLTIQRPFSNGDRVDVFSIDEIQQIIQFTFNNGKVSLANNVDKISKGTEKLGLGSFVYNELTKDTSKAQAVSQLAAIFVKSEIFDYNGLISNMQFWVKNSDWQLLLYNAHNNRIKIEPKREKEVTLKKRGVEFNVNRIVKYLNQYKDNIHHLYTWNAKTEKLVDFGILTELEHYDLNNNEPFVSRPYEKEIVLKKKVNEKLLDSYKNDKDTFFKISLWIIKDWGGIKTAKEEQTKELIEDFLSAKEPSFKRIASSSKVGSYMYPKKNIIYDSRVAYSLNWIILSQNAGNVFFPIPEGRNSKMIAFDMKVLIRLRYIESYKVDHLTKLDKKKYISAIDKNIYIPKNKAYSELNSLIKEISDSLWGDDIEKKENLFYTEMLLFSIADREIYKDIADRLSIKIN